MLVVFAALIPVFLLMVMGYALRFFLLREQAFWNGLERLVYYVLFPALLIDSLARANLANVPVAGAGGALMLAVVLMAALCLALRRLLAASFGVSGPSFTSIFQGATRWQTFVALAVAGNLYGDTGLALASVAMVAMIPLLNVLSVSVLARYASPQRLSLMGTLTALVRNPMIWACIVGLAINLSGIAFAGPLHDFADTLGRSSLAIGLLVVGAGLHFEGLTESGFAVVLTTALKLLLMPVMAIGLGVAFGLTGTSLAVVACCASVPAASNAYILARQMGGDAPLLARILAVETLLAVLTMPVAIAVAAAL